MSRISRSRARREGSATGTAASTRCERLRLIQSAEERKNSSELPSGKINSTNNLYLKTEDGINRVAMRSTLLPGTIRLTATREGLQPATISFDTKPVVVKDGLTQEMPQTLSPPAR